MPKDKVAYEKSLRDGYKRGDARHESQLKPAWVHRLAFIWGHDESLRLLGANLALVARGESAALYSTATTEAMKELQHFNNFQRELRKRYTDCRSALASGHVLSSVETTAFTTVFLQGFDRRFALLLKDVGLDTPVAIEVVANSARQLSEIRVLVDDAWKDYASRASTLPERSTQVAFYETRFGLLFSPAVDTFLGTGSVVASGDVFGPAPFRTGAASKLDSGAAGAKGSLATGAISQSDGDPSVHAKATKPPGRPAPDAVPSPGAGLPAAPPAYAPYSWPPAAPGWYPQGPWPPTFAFGAAPSPIGALVGPPQPQPLPPPPYLPPAIKPDPGASSGGRPPAARQVQFASPPASAIPSHPTSGTSSASPGGRTAADRAADGLDSLYPSGTPFVGKSACAYLSGPRSVRNIPSGPLPGPPCHSKRCSEVGAGPHPTWNCPLRFWAVRKMCPGFLENGSRDPAAWVGDEITDATRAQWRAFDATLRLAAGAAGAPSFD